MMADCKRTLAAALCAAALVGGGPALAAPPAHLDPFPEDAAEKAAAAQPAKPQPPKSNYQPRFRPPNLKPAQPLDNAKSDAVEPANPAAAKDDSQVVPASASEAVPSAEQSSPVEPAQSPELLPAKQPADPSTLTGREALNEAFTLSKRAETEAEYSDIIALCERGKIGVNQKYQDYADQLMGWAYNRRGEVRAKNGDETQALADFETAVRLSGAWRAIHNRGVSYAASGRMEEARVDFDRTIQLNPRYANAYYNRAELRYRQEDYAGAIEDYTQAIKIGPPDSAMFNGRGHAFYRMQAFGDALRDYGEAIKLDPSNPDPLINRGDTYSDLGQYGEAAADYRAAVKVAPQNGRAFQAAAWLMATCPDGQYRDEALAIDAAKRAIELEGETFRTLSTLAAAQASAGQFKEAQETQERAIALAPSDQVVTGEKMMALYRREIAFRDRPITAFETPESTPEHEIRQANAEQIFGPPPERRALFTSPPPAQASRQPAMQTQRAGSRYQNVAPPQQQPNRSESFFSRGSQPTNQQPPAKSRLFGPKGKI
jgi:tetratricopeptide (TPR) repeat protein